MSRLVLTITALAWLLAFPVASLAGSDVRKADAPVAQQTPPCDVSSASPWISRWFAAWELTSRELLRLPDAPPPTIVFYDTACVFTTSTAAAPGATPVDGPSLRGATLPWRAAAHGDTLTLPNAQRVPVGLMSFANSDSATGPFFVMAAPAYWARVGHGEESGVIGVFLHEFAHTRQIPAMDAIIGPIDATWPYEQELNDDVVQTHFASDSVYVAAYIA
jgi:hypothetical protein